MDCLEKGMPPLPTIAIVGRPNVGKSSLLNRIVGRRHAIVDPTPGVTRDRNYAEATWNGRRFNVVDTGGLDPDDHQPIQQAIRAQVEFALREADAILLTCDSRQGLYPDDRTILDLLRRSCQGKPVYVVVNKIDNPLDDVSLAEFYALGVPRLFPVSALHGHGVADLLDVVVEPFPRQSSNEADQAEEGPSRIAIVGKPNVGKSSLFNRLIGQERSIVDDAPGTTRDTIIVSVERGGKTYRFIDTAGLRRPSRQKDSVEFFSVFRTLDTIRKSDLAILVLDASAGEITQQDKRIASRIIEVGSGCLILWNKWDLATHDERAWQRLQAATRQEFPLLEFAPILSCSARTGLRVARVFELIDRILAAGTARIPPDRLKSILFDALTMQPPPPFAGQPVRISSIQQMEGPPVIFRVYTNQPEGVHFSYQRYLLNRLREDTPFEGWPVRLVLRKK
ncbi:MAG: ribosome biogenesis GTPase Der [Candidatus Ozemobacter sibiricus]|jgi:GTP-binding protein|uniref:GTPase Der n=1 Tax=Candidatus Ozemobacter sibiricus TaxID=2268124 RepID=A0A367ZUL6_9BACT|nr:MAG: ribosome biogenesis GTPase Der [Candidatus Ozemobacter sibiricus]